MGVSVDRVPTLEKIIQRGNVQGWALQELGNGDQERLARDMREQEGYFRAEEVFQEVFSHCVQDCSEVKSIKPETQPLH